MTKDEGGIQYTYDAWNRTKKVKTSGGTDKVVYTLDALNRRVAQDVTSSGVGGDTQYYHSVNWQVLEEREWDGSAYSPRWQNVFSLAYIDAVVTRDTLDTTTPGELDVTFSGDGVFTASITAGVNLLRTIVLADGKVLAVGEAAGDVIVVRLTAEGTLDLSFNGTGYRQLNLTGTELGQGIAVQSDGKILISGATSNNTFVARLNDDGSYDTSFKGPGNPVTPIGWSSFDYGAGSYDAGNSIAIQADGKIILGGNTGGDFIAMRLLTDGTRDTSYGTSNGANRVDMGGTDTGYQAVLDHQGRAVLAGDASGNLMAVIRLTTAGILDTTFSGDGKVTTDITAGTDTGRAVAIDQQGRIVVAGDGGGDFAVVRYMPDGTLDASFDGESGSGNGKVTVGILGGDRATEVIIDSRGRIVVGGHSSGETDVAVVRLNGSDGSLDDSFSPGGTDGDGKKLLSFVGSTTAERLQAMVIDGFGRIVLAGRAGNDISVARISGGGARNYLIQDANYNVTATADGAGRIIDRYQYTVYGVWTTLNADFSTDLDNGGEVYQAFYFQGLRFDGNSGNHHARNRDYRASLGRWTQNDPTGYVDGPNLYQSFSANPQSRVDPLGLDDFIAIGWAQGHRHLTVEYFHYCPTVSRGSRITRAEVQKNGGRKAGAVELVPAKVNALDMEQSAPMQLQISIVQEKGFMPILDVVQTFPYRFGMGRVIGMAVWHKTLAKAYSYPYAEPLPKGSEKSPVRFRGTAKRWPQSLYSLQANNSNTFVRWMARGNLWLVKPDLPRVGNDQPVSVLKDFPRMSSVVLTAND